MKAYSNDLRERILSDSKAGLESDELAEKYRVSRSWVDRLKQRYRETGNYSARKPEQTRPRVLAEHESFLIKLVKEKPDRTLNELRDLLDLGVSRMAVWRTLQSLVSTNLTRRFGRCLREESLIDKVPHGHWKTTTFIASLRTSGISAPFLLDGPMDRDCFVV